MNLDKRIKSINDIQSVLNSTKDSVGKVGYFAKNIKNFKDLSKYKYGTVDDYKKDDECFCHLKLTNGITDETWYPYFILEDALLPKEKKYRPYTLKEFTSYYSLGDVIVMRPKAYTDNVKHKLFTEYVEPDTGLVVCLGGLYYSFENLFRDFEIRTSEGWKPFGVEK